MTVEQDEAVRLLAKVLFNTVPKQELLKIVGLQTKLLPKRLGQQFELAMDILISNIPDTKKQTNVALIHGIRTEGRWQQIVRSCLSTHDSVNVDTVGYGFFGALLLWSPFRSGPRNTITRKLRDIQSRDRDADLIIIAHSFGTYLTAKILQQCPDISVKRLILCGSIIHRNFRWDSLPQNLKSGSILNDVGTRDYMPALARCVTLGYGETGLVGFQDGRVHDRYFNFGHSDFFTEDHIEKFWTPFVLSGQVVPSPWEKVRPPLPGLAGFALMAWPVILIVVNAVLLLVVFFGIFQVARLFRLFF